MVKKVSRNRSDYPPEVQAMLHAMADVFHDGDLDGTWERFFTKMEQDPITAHRGKNDPYRNQSSVRMRVPRQ